MQLATSAQMRLADETQITRFATPGLLLMEHAGIAATAHILRQFPQVHTAMVLVGPGNNGGDGLVVARLLRRAGWQVQVLLAFPAERFVGDAKTMWQMVALMDIPCIVWHPACELPLPSPAESDEANTILIDALLGTGINSPLRGPIAEMIAAFRQSPLPVVALDMPSGLDASTGRLLNTPLRTVLTVTFQVPKVCHAVFPAADYCGEVVVADIGIGQAALAAAEMRYTRADADWAKLQLQPRARDTHKGTYGHLLIAAGSQAMSGAAALAAMGAVHSGVGLCTVLTAEAARPVVLGHLPEAMCLAAGGHFLQDMAAIPAALAGKKAVAVGMGIGQQPETAQWLEALLRALQADPRPLVLDADALNLLAINSNWWKLLPPETVLTPHPGEFARLFPHAPDGRLEAALALAAAWQVVVVLKGAGTITAAPDGRAWVNTTGNPGMATGGSGDVLAGCIGALLAQGYPAAEAAALGVWLHGRAGDRCAADQGSVTASGIAQRLGMAFLVQIVRQF